MRTREHPLTPLAAAAAGLLAGAVGTVCLDAVQYLKYRRAGGTESPRAWEFAPVDSWETAPVPGQAARRVIEGFTQRKLPDRSAWLTSTIAHWAYGSAFGAVYGILAGCAPAAPCVRRALRRRGLRQRLHRPAGGRAVPADLEVRRQVPGLGSGRPPGLRRGHRNHVLAPDHRHLVERARMATELVLLGTAGAPMPVAGRAGSRQRSSSTNGSSSSTAAAGRRRPSPTRDWTSPVWKRCSSPISMPTTPVIFPACSCTRGGPHGRGRPAGADPRLRAVAARSGASRGRVFHRQTTIQPRPARPGRGRTWWRTSWPATPTI